MSSRHATDETLLRLFHRCFAVGAVVLTLLLTAAAASPALHLWLHGDTVPDASDSCAVVLFASGVTLATAAVAVAALPLVWRVVRVWNAEEILLASPRYLRQPERGPPVS